MILVEASQHCPAVRIFAAKVLAESDSNVLRRGHLHVSRDGERERRIEVKIRPWSRHATFCGGSSNGLGYGRGSPQHCVFLVARHGV